MKTKIIAVAIISLLVLMIFQASFTPKVKALSIDGDFHDWASISPIVTDSVGDRGIFGDLTAASVTDDGVKLYFKVDFATWDPETYWGRLNVTLRANDGSLYLMCLFGDNNMYLWNAASLTENCANAYPTININYDQDHVAWLTDYQSVEFFVPLADLGNPSSVDIVFWENNNDNYHPFDKAPDSGYVTYSTTDETSPSQLPWVLQFGTIEDEALFGITGDELGNIYATGTTYGSFDNYETNSSLDFFISEISTDGEGLQTKQFGTNAADFVNDLALDGLGNVFVVGETWGVFPGENGYGSIDCFVSKNGDSWIRQFGTNSSDFANGITTDNYGNVYVVGYTHGGFAGQQDLGAEDCFISKFNSEGILNWTKQFGTNEIDSASDVAIDSSGNICVVGCTYGVFYNQANYGGADLFVGKFDSAGNELWIKQFGTNEEDAATCMTTDIFGNIYVAGGTQGVFISQIGHGESDAFVLKVTSEGNIAWSNQFGTEAYDYIDCSGLTTDNTEYIYSAAMTDAYQTNGLSDILISRLDFDGNLQVMQMNITQNSRCGGIYVDFLSNIYIAGGTHGAFPGQTNFGKEDCFISFIPSDYTFSQTNDSIVVRDEFDYGSMEELGAGGWLEYYGAVDVWGDGYLHFYGNSSSWYDFYIYREGFPVDLSSFRVETSAMMDYPFYLNSTIIDPLPIVGPVIGLNTESCWYDFGVNYFTNSFLFYRDGELVWSDSGYYSNLGQWDNFAVEKVGAVFSFFFNGELVGTYEALINPEEDLVGLALSNSAAWVHYDYVEVSVIVPPPSVLGRDDFNYQTTEELVSAGWEQGGEVWVSDGYLTLGGNSSSWYDSCVYREGFPLDLYSYRIETEVMTNYAFYSNSTFVDPIAIVGPVIGIGTQSQWYDFGVNYFDQSFRFYRDGELVWSASGYYSNLNQWDNFAVEKVGSVFSFYFNGELVGTYEEIGESQDDLVGLALTNSEAWVNYDYIEVNGLVPPTILTEAYLDVNPRITGINQTVGITFMVNPEMYVGDKIFNNLILSITKPDGANQTIGPLNASIYGSYYSYIPNQVGNYTFNLQYSGETTAYATYLQSTSSTAILSVIDEEEPIIYEVTFVPVGENVTVSSDNSTVNLAFNEVEVPGSVTISQQETEAPPPTGFVLAETPMYYEIITSAIFNGPIELAIQYDETLYQNETAVRLLHWINNEWVDITTFVDTENNIVYGETNSLSPFSLVELDTQAPTITINSPIEYGIYSVYSTETYNFGVNDNLDTSPNITAILTGSDGIPVSVFSNDALPRTSGVYTLYVTATDEAGNSASKTLMFVVNDISLGSANIWVGLKNSDANGIKFDLKAEVYSNNVLIGSGQLNSALGGSSGFNNAKLNSIPLNIVGAPTLSTGDLLTIKLYVRNADEGSGKNSGTARLWFNDVQADSNFDLSIDGEPSTFYLLNSFVLGNSAGIGPRSTIDVAAGAKGSEYKLFGEWGATVP